MNSCTINTIMKVIDNHTRTYANSFLSAADNANINAHTDIYIYIYIYILYMMHSFGINFLHFQGCTGSNI